MSDLKHYATAMTTDPETGKPMPKMQLSGSNVIQTEVLNTEIVEVAQLGNALYVGQTADSNYFNVSPINVTNYKERAVLVKNNLDVSVTLFGRNTSNNEGAYQHMEYAINNISVPAGATSYQTKRNDQSLQNPTIGFILQINGTGSATTGSITVSIIGGGKV